MISQIFSAVFFYYFTKRSPIGKSYVVQTQRQKQRSASRSLRSNCQHLGSSSLSLSIISGLPLSMEDILVPMDGTTSTPCISTASSFATASSYCADTDEMFQFDSFSEPFKTEVCLTAAMH